jgi:glycerol kinase
MSYILSLDQGTTSSRALVFDRDAKILSMVQEPIQQYFPQAGWVEHDAMEIWHTQLHTARESLQRAGIDARQVSAIGITNQRETTVLWDRSSGEPIAPAIVWQDRRTAGLCERLAQEGYGDLIQQKTGLRLDAYFSATKLRWLLDNVPGARERAQRGELAFGTIDSWLTYRLTGGRCHVTDASNASRTLLFNLQTMDWDDELITLFGIEHSLLPELINTSTVIDSTDPDLFGHPIAIAARVGDQQAATFGQTCFDAGAAKNTYGTGCFLLLNTGANHTVSKNRLLNTVGWQLDSTQTTYCLEGSVFMGGATVQWLRDQLGVITQACDIEALAAQVPDTGDVYLVPAFTGLGAPHWDPNARAMIIGLTRGSGRAHIARAALESIALQVCDVLQAMQADSGQPLAELRVDGGASANDLLMQMQADLLGIDVVRPKVLETTALGAAYLAGLAVGLWRDQADLLNHWSIDRVFHPAMGAPARAAKLERWRQAIERAKQWAQTD